MNKLGLKHLMVLLMLSLFFADLYANPTASGRIMVVGSYGASDSLRNPALISDLPMGFSLSIESSYLAYDNSKNSMEMDFYSATNENATALMKKGLTFSGDVSLVYNFGDVAMGISFLGDDEGAYAKSNENILFSMKINTLDVKVDTKKNDIFKGYHFVFNTAFKIDDKSKIGFSFDLANRGTDETSTVNNYYGGILNNTINYINSRRDYVFEPKLGLLTTFTKSSLGLFLVGGKYISSSFDSNAVYVDHSDSSKSFTTNYHRDSDRYVDEGPSIVVGSSVSMGAIIHYMQFGYQFLSSHQEYGDGDLDKNNKAIVFTKKDIQKNGGFFFSTGLDYIVIPLVTISAGGGGYIFSSTSGKKYSPADFSILYGTLGVDFHIINSLSLSVWGEYDLISSNLSMETDKFMITINSTERRALVYFAINYKLL